MTHNRFCKAENKSHWTLVFKNLRVMLLRGLASPMLQDVIYQNLLVQRRAELHGRVGRAAWTRRISPPLGERVGSGCRVENDKSMNCHSCGFVVQATLQNELFEGGPG